MQALLTFSRGVDWCTERIGRSVYWLLLAAVLISSINAIVRYAFDISSNAYLEAQWYLFCRRVHTGRGLCVPARPACAHRRRVGAF